MAEKDTDNDLFENFKNRISQLITDVTPVETYKSLNSKEKLVSRSLPNKWKKKETIPYAKHILHLCSKLDISPTWLFFGIGPEKLSEIKDSPLNYLLSTFDEDWSLSKNYNDIQVANTHIVNISEKLIESSEGTEFLSSTLKMILNKIQHSISMSESEMSLYVEYDSHNTILDVNKRFCSDFNVDKMDIIGTSYSLNLKNNDFKEILSNNKSSQKFKDTIVLPDSSEENYHLTVNKIFNSQNGIVKIKIKAIKI
ncbi:MAG: hypothetical protein GY714_09745 [Desulfobacterales bacterium]|nr:hypothetical protein [Desulfobacterales bacterium]